NFVLYRPGKTRARYRMLSESVNQAEHLVGQTRSRSSTMNRETTIPKGEKPWLNSKKFSMK
ncbi:MAG TPA: hypothetical protein PLQ88_18895, partial [Blastocatellia bacterium]|nr:hypothetical protein [Blastocatellia bacterium]